MPGNTGILTVADVYSDLSRVLATNDSTTIYSRLNDIVEILSTESDWDPTRGYLDVQVGCDGTVTLPNEVDVVLAVNEAGRPTQMHDFWFQFHLNGPGAYMSEGASSGLDWSWWGTSRSGHVYDGTQVSVFADPDPSNGTMLYTQLSSTADSGTPLRVYGYDAFGNWIQSTSSTGGIPVDGFLVPTVYGTPTFNTSVPPIACITRVSKQGIPSVGNIQLWGQNSNGTIFQMGAYGPNDLEPRYRRIKLSRTCSWARVAFKRRVQPLSQMTDIIFLHSKYAIVTMAMALKKFDNDRIEEGEAYQQKAVSFLNKKQRSISVPTGPSIQIASNNLIAAKNDWLE